MITFPQVNFHKIKQVAQDYLFDAVGNIIKFNMLDDTFSFEIVSQNKELLHSFVHTFQRKGSIYVCLYKDNQLLTMLARRSGNWPR